MHKGEEEEKTTRARRSQKAYSERMGVLPAVIKKKGKTDGRGKKLLYRKLVATPSQYEQRKGRHELEGSVMGKPKINSLSRKKGGEGIISKEDKLPGSWEQGEHGVTNLRDFLVRGREGTNRSTSFQTKEKKERCHLIAWKTL